MNNHYSCMPIIIEKLESLKADGKLEHVNLIKPLTDLSSLTSNNTVGKTDKTLLVILEGSRVTAQRRNEVKMDVEVSFVYLSQHHERHGAINPVIGETISTLRNELLTFEPKNEAYKNDFYAPQTSDDQIGNDGGFVWCGFTITYKTAIT